MLSLISVEGSEVLEQRLVSSFPVTDLQNEYILYDQSDHLNKEPVHDGFIFHVRDGRNRSPSRYFNISVQVMAQINLLLPNPTYLLE